jgi:hypothetical protein
MTRAESTTTRRAFLGRRGGCGAGGHSLSNTAPESPVPSAVSGGGGAGLRPAGAAAGEESA